MKSKGITLLEMLTVIAIIAIMLGIAIPTLNSLSKHRVLFSAGSNVANQMRLARQLAISYRGVYGAWIDITDDQVGIYYLASDDFYDEGASGYVGVDDLYGKIYHAPALTDIVDVTGDITRTPPHNWGGTGWIGVAFNPDGTASFDDDGSVDNAYVHVIKLNELIDNEPYDPSDSYTALNNEKERVKCTTVVIRDITGYPKTYRYGLGDPWPNIGDSGDYIE